MLSSIILFVVLWLILYLILYVLHCRRIGHLVSAPRWMEERILSFCMGLAFGMFCAVVSYLKFTYYN